jgi:uncharacterized protein
VVHATNGREVVVRLADGEDLVQSLRALQLESAVIAAGIGMLRELRLGFWNGRSYDETRIESPVELLSMQGTIARGPEGQVIHCHVCVAGHEGHAQGGHLMAATVTNTAEITLLLVPGIHLERRPESNGLVALFPSREDGIA